MACNIIYKYLYAYWHSHISHYTHLSLTEGLTSQNGDFIISDARFFFSSTRSRSCIDLFVFSDSIVEGPESIVLEVVGFSRTPSGDLMMDEEIVIFEPDTTTIEIQDNDSKIYYCIHFVVL